MSGMMVGCKDMPNPRPNDEETYVHIAKCGCDPPTEGDEAGGGAQALLVVTTPTNWVDRATPNDVTAYSRALRESPLRAPNLEGLPPTSYEQDVVGLFDRAQNPWARKWTRCPFRCCWVCRGRDEQRWMDLLAQLFKEESGGCTAVPTSWGPTIQAKFGIEEAPDWWSEALAKWTDNPRRFGKAFKKPASERSASEKTCAGWTTERGGGAARAPRRAAGHNINGFLD